MLVPIKLVGAPRIGLGTYVPKTHVIPLHHAPLLQKLTARWKESNPRTWPGVAGFNSPWNTTGTKLVAQVGFEPTMAAYETAVLNRTRRPRNKIVVNYRFKRKHIPARREPSKPIPPLTPNSKLSNPIRSSTWRYTPRFRYSGFTPAVAE